MQQINPIKQFYKQLCLWSGHEKFGSLTKKYVKKNFITKKHHVRVRTRLSFAWKCCNLPFLIDGTWFIACWVSFWNSSKNSEKMQFLNLLLLMQISGKLLVVLNDDCTVNSIMKLLAKEEYFCKLQNCIMVEVCNFGEIIVKDSQSSST